MRHLEDIYEEVFFGAAKYGDIEELSVCDNTAEHLRGNVFVKYFYERDAKRAHQALNGRYYAGREVRAEYSPVTDFREASCRLFGFN